LISDEILRFGLGIETHFKTHVCEPKVADLRPILLKALNVPSK